MNGVFSFSSQAVEAALMQINPTADIFYFSNRLSSSRGGACEIRHQHQIVTPSLARV
jgi:hypothetical protein